MPRYVVVQVCPSVSILCCTFSLRLALHMTISSLLPSLLRTFLCHQSVISKMYHICRMTTHVCQPVTGIVKDMQNPLSQAWTLAAIRLLFIVIYMYLSRYTHPILAPASQTSDNVLIQSSSSTNLCSFYC